MGSNALVWVHLEKKLLCCNGLGSIELGRFGSAHDVLTCLGSTVLRIGLLSWGYLGSPMIHCVWLGSVRLGLTKSKLGYILCISAALSLVWQGLD